MVVGGLVAKAAAALRARMPAGATLGDWARSLEEPVREFAKYEPPPGIVFDEKTYRGDGYGAYAWGCNVVELEVDLDTGETTVGKLYAAIDGGRIINPVLAEGQVEGGSAQGLGWATIEEMKTAGGRYLNDRMSTYIIPTALDTPPITVKFIERPYEYGGHGAKGIGEIPLDGPAPAVAAAIFHATGWLPHEIPATPEKLLEALG
jgi:CO/xanthine dehydrogenase Mo-binding subunit